MRDEQHPHKARDLAAALPEGWSDELAEDLPAAGRHQHYLSGNSSQTLALGLLGVSARRGSSLGWLWEGLSLSRSPLPPRSEATAPPRQFELTLAAEVLGEQPRQTSIDFAASTSQAMVCLECKWVEAGMGACSCSAPGPETSTCSDRVLSREAYWEVAKDVFRLPELQVGKPCPLSFTYQVVRNVAAALAMAARQPGQLAVFGLIYDAENPYFAGCGEWPGWSAALHAALPADESPVRFASVSWQELLPLLPLDEATLDWRLIRPYRHPVSRLSWRRPRASSNGSLVSFGVRVA